MTESKKGHHTDTLAGIEFPDPYRWLEGNGPDVVAWQNRQRRIAAQATRGWPHYENLKVLVAELSAERSVAIPRWAGGRWFWTATPDGANHTRIYASPTLFEDGCIVFDAREYDPAAPPFVSWVSPSPNGEVVALGLCRDGSERNRIVIVDVSSRRPRRAPTQPLMDNWTGGAHWLADSGAFVFVSVADASRDFDPKIFLFSLESDAATELSDIPWVAERAWRTVTISRDGKYAVAFERLRNPVPVATGRIAGHAIAWRPFVTGFDGMLSGHIVGDAFIGITDAEAPRGRIVRIPLDCADPDNRLDWEEIVPETGRVMRSLVDVDGAIYLTEMQDTYSRVRFFSGPGFEEGKVALPEGAVVAELPFALMNLAPRGHPRKFVFAYSTLTSSPELCAHAPGMDTFEVLRPSRIRLDATVEDRWAISQDGTRVPYHTVRGRSADGGCGLPALIYAYGGYNVPELPQYPGAMAAVIESGGLFVHANIRGGGEFGSSWWRSGSRKNKQRSYDDLYAVASDLRQSGQASRIALMGASNGGLMAGVAALQRPDLWKAVVPRVPMFDMIGACRESYGRLLVALEYGDIADPADVRRLASLSPYQMRLPQARLPAIYIDAGETDQRCPAWHARKLAARLQDEGQVVLLHVREGVGHGWATDGLTALEQNTEWLAFVFEQLGLHPRSKKPAREIVIEGP
jgi:prolyl oligopeptidase